MAAYKDKDFGNAPLLFTSPMGDEAFFYNDDCMIVRLNGHRGVVSTSNVNGGYRNDLRYLFNHSCGKQPEVIARSHVPMKGSNVQEHYAAIAVEMGLPVTQASGIGTAALIENTAIATRSYHNVAVMAVATAGIDINGGRAGDKATYNEFEQKSILQQGTINIFLFINALLDPGALTRAVVTATEAKTAALLELMANSCFSQDLATGSGTDALIAVSNDDSPTRLFSTGKHVLLGEMIGESVKESVKEALAKQTGMTPKRQASIEWQNKRYGITRANILSLLEERGLKLPALDVVEMVDRLNNDNEAVAITAAITHLCDQNRWGMISDESLRSAALHLISHLYDRFDTKMPAGILSRSDDWQRTAYYQWVLSALTASLCEVCIKA